MATLRAMTIATLEANAPLMAILTGGVLDAQDLPRDGGGMDSAPKETDGVRIAPHAVVRWRENNQFDAVPIGAEKTLCEIYLYDHIGYARIDQAIRLIKPLFHQLRFQADDRQFVFFNWVHSSGELEAEEYNNAPMRFTRFEVFNVS